MITFNQLNITPDNRLIIDISIDNFSYYSGIELDSIIIDSQDTFVNNGPSKHPVYKQIFTHNCTYDYIYSSPDTCNPVNESEDRCVIEDIHRLKHKRIILTEKELGVSLDNSMLFVYVIANGYPSPDTPCGCDNNKVMGVAVNLYPYYKMVMNGIKEINSTCDIPKNFIDHILRFKAVQLSIKTGNYIQAIEYWKKFFNNSIMTNNRHCGCYGRNN